MGLSSGMKAPGLRECSPQLCGLLDLRPWRPVEEGGSTTLSSSSLQIPGTLRVGWVVVGETGGSTSHTLAEAPHSDREEERFFLWGC